MENNWPDKLLVWYHQNARALPFRQNPSPYAVWVSEIMLQQTRMNAVLPYYARFMAAFPDVFSLANAEESQVLKAWEGLGYYSRARNLHKAAKIVAEKHGGTLPNDRKALLALPGIGEYTAGAILSIAFGKPCPAVDGNVLRVLARRHADGRFADLPAVKNDAKETLAKILTPENASFFTQAMMELGALVCLPKRPLCNVCPLAADCQGFLLGIAGELPKKSPKKPRKIQEKTVFFLHFGGKTALTQGESGVLQGLWHLPSAVGVLNEKEAETALAKICGGRPSLFLPLGSYTHVFTHIQWPMNGYLAVFDVLPESGFRWAAKAELAAEIALPSAFRPFVERGFALLSGKNSL